MKALRTLNAAMVTGLIFVLLALPAAAEPVRQAETDRPALQGKININTATVKQLKLLPGVGKKTAENIVAYRKQKGGFTAVEELLKVKGFGQRTFKKSREFLMLKGENTLKKLKKG